MERHAYESQMYPHMSHIERLTEHGTMNDRIHQQRGDTTAFAPKHQQYTKYSNMMSGHFDASGNTAALAKGTTRMFYRGG